MSAARDRSTITVNGVEKTKENPLVIQFVKCSRWSRLRLCWAILRYDEVVLSSEEKS